MPESLHRLAPFHIGAVAKWPQASVPGPYSSTLLAQFSSLTPERALKASCVHPHRSRFNWTEADELIDFCEKQGKRFHGHTLIWDRDLPPWIAGLKESAPELIEEHVTTVAARYAGRIEGWDVVNEAFSEEGELRTGTWHSLCGEDYLTRAFIAAAAADPTAKLFYNDFDLETNHVKRGGVLRHLNSLRDAGVKIDGIGLQLHLNISTAHAARIGEAMTEIASQGYLLHISELDISVNPYEGTINSKDDLLRQQAELLKDLVILYEQLPASSKYGITFWGVGDADSWLTQDLRQIDFPLLFDEEYRPKPCWNELVAYFLSQK